MRSDDDDSDELRRREKELYRHLYRRKRRMLPWLGAATGGAMLTAFLSAPNWPDLFDPPSEVRAFAADAATDVTALWRRMALVEAQIDNEPADRDVVDDVTAYDALAVRMEPAGLRMPLMTAAPLSERHMPVAGTTTDIAEAETAAEPPATAVTAPPIELASPSEREQTTQIEQTGSLDRVPEHEPVATEAAVAPDAARLVLRSADLLSRGDISGARLLLERAASSGDARAIFALAETYDPDRLSAWKTIGIRADREKARALYSRAEQRGVIEAKLRLDALR